MLENGYDLKTSAALDLADAESDTTRLFLELWRSKAGPRFAPSRGDFDWLELPMDVVPRIMIVDVLADPLDFRYRYFGTWHVDCHEHDMTGRCVSDYGDVDYRSFVAKDYANVLAVRAPTLTAVSMILKGLRYRCEILRLPLSQDDREIDMIMVVESAID